MFELVLICGVLALLEMDTTYLGQFLFSRPTCAGAIMGYLCGDFFLGLQAGIFTELIFIDFVPVGGVVPPSGAICAGIAVILAGFFGIQISLAFFIGLICSLLFSRIEKNIRRYRSKLLPDVEKKLYNGLMMPFLTPGSSQYEKMKEEGSLSPLILIIQSFLMEYLVVFAFVLTMASVLGPSLLKFSKHIPETVSIAFNFSYFLVPWIGLSMLFISFSTKQES